MGSMHGMALFTIWFTVGTLAFFVARSSRLENSALCIWGPFVAIGLGLFGSFPYFLEIIGLLAADARGGWWTNLFLGYGLLTSFEAPAALRSFYPPLAVAVLLYLALIRHYFGYIRYLRRRADA